MKYKITHNKSGISKMKVLYQCPFCATNLKNPINEAGNSDRCPECGGELEVPGKSEYDYYLKREEQQEFDEKARIESEEKIRTEKIEEAVNEMEQPVENESRLQTINKRWHHTLNEWIVDNLSAVNACMFVLILFACSLIGVNAGQELRGGGIGKIVGFLIGTTVGVGLGLVYCGIFSIILSICKNISRIADALENRNA